MAQTVSEGNRNLTKLAYDEIKEEPIQVQKGNRKLNDAFCDVCLIETLNVNIALYLCYICNKYLCQVCFKEHESHPSFEKREKERLKKCFRDDIMKESKSERKERLDKEDVSFVERVNVKYELDKHKYRISGLCGLDDSRWVVCDIYNSCIKVFSIGSHILQRYIRFGSGPYGVTSIHVERKKVKPFNRYSFKRFRDGIKTFFSVEPSVPNQPKPDKQFLLAVTVPDKRRIWFIDLTQEPAVLSKSIKTKKRCNDIAFSGDRFVTICNDKYGYGPWFIYVLSTVGVTLNTIKTPLNCMYNHCLAICPGKFYLTDGITRKVLCMNEERKVVSQNTIEESWPWGINVDPDTEMVYISDWGNNKLYRLDSRLENCEFLFKFNLENTGRPESLCVHRDRVYVGHDQGGSIGDHIVSVVRVL